MKRSIRAELAQLKEKGLYRNTRLVQGAQSSHVRMDDREMLLLCSNNYLGLADRPELKKAAISATTLFGTSSSASRLVSGTMELHEQLEQEIAWFKKTEAALLFNSGYAANTGLIGGLVGRGDVIFSDRLNHASIVDGALLSAAKLIRYPHNDADALSRMMEKERGNGRCLIVTDGVFSMDGDIAPLKELLELKKRYDAILMVDDAHGSGVLGENGAGTAELLGVADGIDIHMGTFGKALGSFGAYAAISSELRQLFINRSRSFIFSTSLPPAVLGASLAALKIVQSAAGKELRESLAAKTAAFKKQLCKYGFQIGTSATQIIPVMTGDAEVTMQFTDQLLQEGIFAQGIRPPTVPAGSCRLRCTIMATHTDAELAYAAECIASVGRRLGVI